MWTYLTTPFLFAMDGIATEELQPWREDGETWRRLKVTFPDGIATHSAVQVFYFGSDGLLKRHDYDADVLGGSPAAHYVHEYQMFWGFWSQRTPGARATARRHLGPRAFDRDDQFERRGVLVSHVRRRRAQVRCHIRAVLRAQKELVKVTRTLGPVLNYKGT